MRRMIALSLAVVAVGWAGCHRGPAPVGGLSTQSAQLTLAWPTYEEIGVDLEPGKELPPGAARPTVFLHLLDEPGSVERTFDHVLPEDWKPGQPIHYRARIYQSALAEPLAPGRYILSMGLYDAYLGRYSLVTAGKEIARQEYQVATIVVPAVEPGGPQARFSDNWLPPEPGADRQILVRRTLRAGGPGTVQFGPLAGPGRILVGVTLPTIGPATGGRVELENGALQPQLRISSSCGGDQAEVSGGGRFDVELQVPKAGSPSVCELTLEPNFRLTVGDRPDSISVQLELLAWRPSPGDASSD